MTPQEAIKWADGKALEIICELEVTKSKERQKRLNEEYSALTTFKSCAEKQIPIKPLDKTLEYDGYYGLCPCCNRVVGDNKDFSRCWYCGQALDWSDTECTS